MLSRRSVLKTLGCMAAALALSAPSAALAQNEPLSEVVYQQDGTLTEALKIPIYEWTMPQTTPRGVVLAVHGVAMHGKSFDYLGKNLAAQGYYVYATDMRGYGRSFHNADHTCKVHDCRHKVNYDKSYDEVMQLAKALRQRFPSLPIFGLGESLGTNMVMHLAAEHPEFVDGLVLSAPAVRRHTMLDGCMVFNAGLVMANPRMDIDLMPFVRRYASDDPRVIAEMESDPLLRRKMNAMELIKATVAIRKTITYVPKIPSNIPVLVIQGGNDRVLHAGAVMQLLSKLHSQDQTVKWFASRGHILLETEFVKPDTMQAVVGWLNGHVQSSAVQAKYQDDAKYVAAELVSPRQNTHIGEN